MNLEHLINMKPGETKVIQVRRHPITLIGSYIVVLLVALVPVAVAFLVLNAWPGIFTGPKGHAVGVLVTSAYELIVLLFIITTFVEYYLDIWIVTSHRIVSVDQHSLFNRKVSELDLTKVQDVTSTVVGVIPSIFGYGNVLVQTAAEMDEFIFLSIPRAHDVRKQILDLVDKERQRQIAPIVDSMQ